MKIVLVYFSATGNTHYLANILANNIVSLGHHCELFNIEKYFNLPELFLINPIIPDYISYAEKNIIFNNKLNDFINKQKLKININKDVLKQKFLYFKNYLQNFDIVGFGSPVYFFNPPAIFQSFIDMLPIFDKKIAFTFATHMEGPIGFKENIKRLLEVKGFLVYGHFDTHVIHTELLPFLPKYLVNKNMLKRYFDYRNKIIQKSVRRFLNSLGIFLNSNVDNLKLIFKKETSKFELIIAKIVEKFLYLTMKYYFGSIIDKSKCIKCNLCVNFCPIGVILVDEKTNYPIRNVNCMYCLRCVNVCPNNAIAFTKLSYDKFRFKGFEELNKIN